MRLIDADALIEFIDVGHLRPPAEICFSERDVKNLVDKQPTIEPKKGEWRLWDGPNWYICSECGAVRRQITFMEHYCPNCGADMRGEQE